MLKISLKSQIEKENIKSTAKNDKIDFENDQKQTIKCTCIQEEQENLESIFPFKVDFNLLSMQVKQDAYES